MAETPIITWRDRKIPVRRPGAMQIATWERTVQQASKFDEGTGELLTDDEKKELLVLLDRLLRIVRSLFATDEDKQWLEDLLIDGEVTDQDLVNMLTQAMDGLIDAKPTKTNKPAPKATRRA